MDKCSDYFCPKRATKTITFIDGKKLSYCAKCADRILVRDDADAAGGHDSSP